MMIDAEQTLNPESPDALSSAPTDPPPPLELDKEPEVAHYACAVAAHEVNRAYCAAFGDASQPPWSEAPQWQKDSAMHGVEGVMRGNSPEQSHEGWLAEKIATGWVYGPVKDTEKKEHPCMLPYDELPPSQKAKDALFVRTVRSMASALGWAGPK